MPGSSPGMTTKTLSFAGLTRESHWVECAMSDVLSLQDIRRTFRQGGESIEVLRGADLAVQGGENVALLGPSGRSEEHTSELQSLMGISYAVFRLKIKIKNQNAYEAAR